ncbi:Pentatricopeptide repeat [Macleaya cordata]|uniref:Pentatricopeptide repeat n=1 Tax=Macleaya cordata TaxID=56857 RepID=A0A200R7B3_MACCD|nr:Pentatricopeptide repeat [Macleaya cordata]
MDVSFSAKPLTLTPVSYFSFSSSSSSSSSSFSSPRFYLLRKEFLGCGHRLKLPELQSRRKCKKLVFQIQSPRFLFRASLFSEPVLVIVAVAVTFSALTVLYLNFNNRRKKDSKELSGVKDPNSLENLEVSKQGKGFAKLDLPIADTETPVKESEPITGKDNLNGHIYEERVVHYQKTKVSESNGCDVLASSASGVVSTKETEAMGVDFPPPLLNELHLEQVNFAMEMPPEAHKGETVMDPELSRLMVELEPTSSVSTTSVKDLSGDIHNEQKLEHEMEEASELQVSSYTAFFRESAREELHTFYEENQSGMRSLSNLKELKPILPHISGARIKNISSLLEPTTISRADLSVEVSHNTTDYLEGEMRIAYYRGGSSRKRKNFGKDGEFPKDMGKRLLAGQRDLFPQPNGIEVNGKCDPSEYFSAYNRLLRGGRLTGCIELLESMEQRGMLDMDKVYHARFFNTCKSQKAVKEAFRFTNLIQKPTLSTFNMLLSVCASAQDSEGAFQVLQLVKEAGLKADCKLYTTLISTCAKSGKVDAMFEVFHEMVNAGVEPNVHTYGALIDGCARAGQVAKAFGAYGILRSKKVKPDRVVFNALITACGQSGAVDRAFDVLAEMRAEPTPIDPDHVTVGALIRTCAQAGQFDRARKVYKMVHQYHIKGTPEVYTIAVNSCSQMGDIDFALTVYGDMKKNGVVPDEMFLSALINVAGRAGKIDTAFEIVQEARTQGARLGNVLYGSLMGACSNAKDWQKALELYEDIKAIKLCPTVSTLNALITALCDGDQLQKAVEVLDELKKVGVCPNIITYSVLVVASQKKDDLELASMLYSQAKKDGVVPNLVMFRCLIGMCLRRFEKAYSLGEHILSFNSGKPQIDNKWTSLALNIYRENIIAAVVPTIEVFSEVLGCLQFPHDTSIRTRLVENLGVSTDASRCPNLFSLIDGFGEYDPRSFSLLEEAASLGVVPCVSFKESPIVVDARKLHVHTAEVYLLTFLKGLKHRLAAGAKLPNVTILLPVEKAQVVTPKGEKTVNLVGRVGQAVGALLRRMGLSYQGNESYGRIRISGLAIKRWFQPKLDLPPFSGKPTEFNSSQARWGKGITDQQRNIRTSNLSLD